MSGLGRRAVEMACVAMMIAWCAAAEEPPVQAPPLRVGDHAPDFVIEDGGLPDEDIVRLSDFRGKSVLVAFFPKTFSVGCTLQFRQYRDEFDVFKAHGTGLVAISGDSPADSERFRREFQLPFPVVGDPEHAIINAYHVPLIPYMGHLYAQRCVFLIDEEGVIRYIDMNYSVLQGKEQLYTAIQALAEDAGDSERSRDTD